MPGTKVIPVKHNPDPPPLATPEPFNATVPETDDTLEFRADPEVEFDTQQGGIQFESAEAPYTNRTVVDSRKITFSVDHDPAKAGIRWSYTILVDQGPIVFPEDPTVENEPIP